MKARSKSNWLIDAIVVAASVAAIMATTGGARALPIAPSVGCQVQQGGAMSKVAVLRPDLTTVWFERDSATLSDAGARTLLSAVQNYEPGTVMKIQVMGGERPNRPSDHVAIDRVSTVAAVAALNNIPADAISIRPPETELGCAG
jgi:hypothetical protein